MNLKNVFKKNQIIIYTMAFMLICAGYFNYIGKVNNQEIETSVKDISKSNLESIETVEQSEGNKNEGDENNSSETSQDKLKQNEINQNIDNQDLDNQDLDNQNKDEQNEKQIKGNSQKSTDTINSQNDKTENKSNKVADIGDATLVNSNDVVEDDYFAKAKTERETMYSQMLETFESILNNPHSMESQREMATVEMAKINETKKCIMICENLLETKGFKNCVIFVNDGSVSVIVGTKELKAEQTAQIQNIINRELGAIPDNIHISTKQM